MHPNFENEISKLDSLNLERGEFRYCTEREWTDKQIKEKFSEARGSKALNRYGVYVIYGSNTNGEELIYVGLSGTIQNNGSIGQQCLHKRLHMKQGKESRPKFFHELIHDGRDGSGPFPGGLYFRWFETYRNHIGTPPFLAEALLLAAYLKDCHRLPPLNRNA